MYNFHSEDFEGDIQMLLQTQEKLVIIDHQQGIKCRNKQTADGQGGMRVRISEVQQQSGHQLCNRTSMIKINKFKNRLGFKIKHAFYSLYIRLSIS